MEYFVMFDRLTRYMIRQTVWPLVMVTLVLTGIIWLTQSLRMLDLIINQGQSFGTFMEMTLLFQTGVINVILPISLFIAVLYAVQRLIADSEMVVVFAAGVGRWRIAKPFLMVAGGTLIMVAIFNLWLMPLGLRTFKERLVDIRADIATAMVRAGNFSNPVDGLTVYVRERFSDGEVRGVLVQDARNPNETTTFLAETGKLLSVQGRPRLVMYNGSIQRAEPGTLAQDHDPVTFLYFDQYTFDLAQFTPEGQTVYFEPRERYVDELFAPPPGDVYARDRPNHLISEGHDRLSSLLYPLSLTLIALAVLLPAPFSRRGYSKRILIGAICGAAVRLAGFGAINAILVVPSAWPLAYLVPIVAGGLAIWEISSTGISKLWHQAVHLLPAPSRS